MDENKPSVEDNNEVILRDAKIMILKVTTTETNPEKKQPYDNRLGLLAELVPIAWEIGYKLQ